MNPIAEGRPETMFRHLPLTEEQDREVRHYIHVRVRRGEPWDTPELQAMLGDMLSPPELGEDETAQARDSAAAVHAGTSPAGVVDARDGA